MNHAQTVLLVGCGDLGIRVAAQLPAGDYRPLGVRRSPEKLPVQLQGPAADYTRSGQLGFVADLAPEVVVATLVPLEFSDAGYRAGFRDAMANLVEVLAISKPRLAIMVSSTRVYAERDGGWVDETSALAVGEPRSAAIIEAESLLLSSGLNAAVVRFGGIYGDPEGRLLERIASGRVSAASPRRFTNRIHRDDAAGFLAHLITRNDCSPCPVYNGVDDCPAPAHEVETWIAERLGVTPREYLPAAAAGHKRCRNLALHQSGYRLQYPDYRAGYGEVLGRRRAPR